MTIKTLQVDGIGPAIHAMRNPMNSWKLSDTHQGKVGHKDRELSEILAKAGPEHAKHLRMIMVWVEVTAPLYWWKEFDTYRMGVEKLSCSTMHKIHERELGPLDFEVVDDEDETYLMMDVIPRLNSLIRKFKDQKLPFEERKTAWKKLIADLPSSYLQRRTVMISYSALRKIYEQREGHKLSEWQQFRDWMSSLPESWMITDEAEEDDVEDV